MHNDSDLNETIILERVGKTYEGETLPALRGVSFSVRQGEFVCLIGPSGCGKSTVLKLIAGLEEATTGVVKRPERVAMSFQLGALFPWLTVFENVALGLRQQGISTEGLRRGVDAQLRMVKIQDLAGKYPADLSGGQRQRVGIARALAVNPAVLLLDEPFSALDAKTTAELHDDLLVIWKETKKTIVLVSHLIEEAVSLADRVILMKSGAVNSIYPIGLPHPRREMGAEFMRDVERIRREFFK